MPGATAIWFDAPRSVELRAESLPPIGPDQLQVRTLVSAISHGTEMLVYRGQVPAGAALDLPSLAGDFSFPVKYGYASVGRVTGVGPAIRDVERGDLVFALHPHQTEYVVSADLARRLPGGVPPERALFAANLETALNALLDEPVRLGERVVVFGQGVVGTLVAMLARRNGAGRLLVVDAYERRRALAVELGADVALAPGPELIGRLGDATQGRGADLVFEASGNPAALQAAIDVVAPHGTVVVCSWYGAKPVSLELGGRFHRGRVRVRSSQVGQVDPALLPRWDRARRSAEILTLLGELPLERLVSHRIRFEDAAAAYRLVDERPEETVQVVLTYPPD